MSIIIGLLLLLASSAFAQQTATVPPGGNMTLTMPGNITILVGAGTASPTVTPTPRPTNTATATPAPTPTPVVSGCMGVTGKTWMVAAGQPLPPAQSGDAVLFRAGDIFNVEWDDPPSGICISSYGNGRAIFDGQGTKRYAIGSVSGNNSPPPSDHITIDNLEVRHYAQMGVAFINHDGGASGQLQQITVSNSLIYDNGPGCAQVNGPCVGNDPGGYLNSLTLEDDRIPTQKHDWRLISNTVKWCGGHNCVQVHFDAGPTQVVDNVVGPGCVHGCLDVKGSGSASAHAVIAGNIAGCGLSQNLCGNTNQSAGYYSENTYNTAGEFQDYINDIAQDSPVGFQACAGGCTAGNDCPMNLTYQGNSVAGATQWALYLGNNACGGGGSSTAHSTLTNNAWGGGQVHAGF